MIGYTNISPAIATEILNHNTWNRDLKSGLVEQYARDMIAGNWKKNGATIVIANDNSLLDGQHRLWAIVESGVTVPMIIIRGVDKSAVGTIDTGKSRTYADYRKLAGNATGSPAAYAHGLQAVVRLVHWYDKRWPAALHTGGRSVGTHSELDEILDAHPSLVDRTAEVYGSKKLTPLGAAQLGFVYGLASEKYPDEARAWLELIKTGDAERTNPARMLRETLTQRIVSGRPLAVGPKVVYVIKSWNAFTQSTAIAQLRWRPEEPIPAIFGTPQYTGKKAAHSALFRKQQSATTRHEKSSAAQLGKRKRRPRGGS